MFRFFLSILGILLALPLLVFSAIATTLPVTLSGWIYILGAFITVSGFILAPKTSRYSILILSGILTIILVAATRIYLVQNASDNVEVLRLPQSQKTSWFNSLIDEQDALLFGETFFHWIGGDSDREHAGLTTAFQGVYSEMRHSGNFSSPIVSTYLNLQKPEHFDAVIIGPETAPEFGVIFLHGYMGNVTAQCWVIAQAVEKLGGMTICPSTAWTGAWWEPNGQLILRNTFDYLREQGIEKIYLGGFSNGGFSIGRLASQLVNENGLSGLIFIDGFINGGQVRELGLPVLIIEGTQDERVPVNVAHQFTDEVGELGTYVELNSDHFLIIKQPEGVQNAIAAWLADH